MSDKMKKELVTVILPVYNVENYISRCLETVLNQTYRNLEIIIVDDGSQDGSSEICKDYSKKDSRIKYIRQENKGLAGARNTALKVMNGDYVVCVDTDDFVANNMIECLLDVAITEKADFVSCDHKMVTDDLANKFINVSYTNDIHTVLLTKEEALIWLFDEKKHYCSAWAKLYNSKLWREGIFYPDNNRFGEDMFVAHKLIDKANKIVHIEADLYYYNQSGVSLVRSVFNDNKLNMLVAAKEWVDFCKIKYPMVEGEAKAYYYSNFVNFFTLFIESERLDLYRKYKKILTQNKKEIFKNKCINNREKIKAFFVLALSPQNYSRLRKMAKRR